MEHNAASINSPFQEFPDNLSISSLRVRMPHLRRKKTSATPLRKPTKSHNADSLR
jgi:hypothetical protein